MKKYEVNSFDGTSISVEVSGEGECALVFIHGWLGNKSWWKDQINFFEKDYQVARMDLAGHGESGKERKSYTSSAYAEDIAAVSNSLNAKKVILIGHSMSGAYVLEAVAKVSNLTGLIVVDTLKDLEQSFTSEQVETFLDMYRNKFQMTVETVLPSYLFASTTPKDVKLKIQSEFLSQSAFACDAIEALYRMDLKLAASKVKVSVRAINSDIGPTNKEVNQKYLKDYDFIEIKGTGHYPMLENPSAFNSALEESLKTFNCKK
jgi:pimeloyl-ACP methyl ester carboxylesterase